MLQIRLNKDSTAEGGGGGPKVSGDIVTVACPDHLVLADLPVAKSLGVVSAASVVKTVGRRSRRQLGERVHFCVRCDFPIAIYGRLSPCEHAYCLDCARSDSICYLCDERIQKIQTIKMMEGIFVCAAPHCLKSFLKKVDFETHVHQTHANLLQPNVEKEEVNESTVSESTARAPTRPAFSPSSNSQLLDRHQQQSRPPFFGQNQNRQSESQANYSVPITPNLGQNAPPPGFNHPHFQSEGGQPFYNGYEMVRQDSVPEVGSQQGPLLGFPANQAVPMNFQAAYHQPWNPGAAGMPFAPLPSSQGYTDGFPNSVDLQGRSVPFQGGFGQPGSGTG